MTKKYENRIKKLLGSLNIKEVKSNVENETTRRDELFDIRYLTGTPLEVWDEKRVIEIINQA